MPPRRIRLCVLRFSAEGAVEEGLEEVLGLAQGLALPRPQPFVPRHQRGEVVLLVEWRKRKPHLSQSERAEMSHI